MYYGSQSELHKGVHNMHSIYICCVDDTYSFKSPILPRSQRSRSIYSESVIRLVTCTLFHVVNEGVHIWHNSFPCCIDYSIAFFAPSQMSMSKYLLSVLWLVTRNLFHFLTEGVHI